jgi:hypothetical protein
MVILLNPVIFYFIGCKATAGVRPFFEEIDFAGAGECPGSDKSGEPSPDNTNLHDTVVVLFFWLK